MKQPFKLGLRAGEISVRVDADERAGALVAAIAVEPGKRAVRQFYRRELQFVEVIVELLEGDRLARSSGEERSSARSRLSPLGQC